MKDGRPKRSVIWPLRSPMSTPARMPSGAATKALMPALTSVAIRMAVKV